MSEEDRPGGGTGGTEWEDVRVHGTVGRKNRTETTEDTLIHLRLLQVFHYRTRG